MGSRRCMGGLEDLLIMANSLLARNVVSLCVVTVLLGIAILLTVRSKDTLGLVLGLVMIGAAVAWIVLLIRRIAALRRAQSM
jgi:hypothetical protein